MLRNSELKGIDIPRCRESLKATLFADDTTVFLAEEDDFADLQRILDTWKTQIIPIGAPTYRKELLRAHAAGEIPKNYPSDVHMAQDGEATRVLGAWIGNGVDDEGVWTPVLAKVAKTLERWTISHPTLEGKRHVVQMFLGGMTQFLTDVQCMPDLVRKCLNKITSAFLWNDRQTPPINRETTYLPFEFGGMQILDLKSRNEAIAIMWLKEYLTFNAKKPWWTYLADDIFASQVSLDQCPREHHLRLNPFLQAWKPKLLALPPALRELVTVAENYNLRMEGLAFSRHILWSLPMWAHGEPPMTRDDP
ncbi:uncharacterized protein BXZ73DRAFT_93580 [Epithele typhae]|uniref:uncharacterized protein n=1 Tax=Epithele typhae TaxID=378194 RepID=UPI0020079173|nr:uncharacterized protein BXZ73DRAFT_93580 [Epithele typhae]KAH9910805.1 hypothetical protein BXZ73DRAFT_93580 [Epithele typhae]